MVESFYRTSFKYLNCVGRARPAFALNKCKKTLQFKTLEQSVLIHFQHHIIKKAKI